MTATDRDYVAFLDALADGEASFLVCPEGHGTVPPAGRCPTCGAAELADEPLPAVGHVAAATRIHTPLPTFDDDAPYVTAVASFGAVSLTGVVRGVEPDAVEPGLTVEPTVETTETTGDRVVVFRPRD